MSKNHPIVFIPTEILKQALNMTFKREVKFALAAWAFAPANSEVRIICRRQILKMANMTLNEDEFKATLRACRTKDLLPKNIKIK